MSFCCDRFLSFLESIPDSITSESVFISYICERIDDFADDLGLGRLVMHFHAKPTSYESENNTINSILYQHELVHEDNFHLDTYHDRDESVISFTVYPKINHNWTREEKDLLHFFTNQLFLHYSRIRLFNCVQKASVTDPLTGICNTAGFVKYASMLKAQSKLADYTGIFLNLKGFRYINQRFGFKYGDDAMLKFTQRVKSYLLEDELFARLGCDNFALLIRNEHLDSFLDSIQSVRVHVQLEEIVTTFDLAIRAGLYSICPNDSLNDIINRITVAGLIAKTSQHHNTIWFRDDMMTRYIHDKEVSNSFSSAIEEQEFVVYYQPKVLLDGQILCGCEALARWERNGEILQPSEFVPILEQEGVICLLDFYVLETVCRDIRKWIDQGIEPVKVSTNFSKIHLHNKNLAKDILKIIDYYEIDSKYIEIELTESSGYEDYDALSAFINTMKEHGVGTSIDDFGTGYSSLNLLKDLNVDTIKLDKSFLSQHRDRNKADEIVIKTIINMATDLDMQVVCEGIETAEQMFFLKSLRCPIAQGFLFDEPLTHDCFVKRLKNNRFYQNLTNKKQG